MSFLDMIKKSVVEEFSGTLSTGDLFFSLLTAFIAALLISYIYKKTYTGVAYTKSFLLSLILLSMVTSLVIRTINSNLALSLGMVGALSIVRFRTAVKDPLDTIFMFWAITSGIMAGAGIYLTTVVATLILGILYMISYMMKFKKNEKYLVVIKTDKNFGKQITEFMDTKKKNSTLKTEFVKKDTAEFTYEITNKEVADELLGWKDKKEIESIHLVSID